MLTGWTFCCWAWSRCVTVSWVSSLLDLHSCAATATRELASNRCTPHVHSCAATARHELASNRCTPNVQCSPNDNSQELRHCRQDAEQSVSSCRASGGSQCVPSGGATRELFAKYVRLPASSGTRLCYVRSRQWSYPYHIEACANCTLHAEYNVVASIQLKLPMLPTCTQGSICWNTGSCVKC